MPPTFVIADLVAQQAQGYNPSAEVPVSHRAVRRLGALAALIVRRPRAARHADLRPVA